MKALWFVLGAVALTVSCSGDDASVSKTQQALTSCRTPSFSGTVTSSGVTLGVWTGTAMTAEVPLEVTVSSNMPTGTISAQPQHILDLGYSRPDGTFRADVRCTYQGKYLTTGAYRSALVGCSPSNPGRIYAFNKATIQTSWSVLPPSGTTWTVTATPREIFDDDNACTTDTCTGAGATHVYNGNPGCSQPNPFAGLPSVDPSLTSSVPDDAAKLFASQGGTPGSLDPRRAAIARGYVYETNNTTGAGDPAVNVVVSVLEHPELGSKLSRADGTYELAVNAGGPMTLSYQKAGTLGAQRNVDLRWHEFRKVQDVQLVSHNDPGTAINTTLPQMQIARGRAESDGRGSRQASILIPGGITSPDIAAGTWTFHVTEFTAGADGARRMPGALPDASGFTYAFAADITEANGAHVTFNKPLIFYVDNFPNFKIGINAPLGWYDDAAGLWRGEKSGRVVRVLRIAAGSSPARVEIDVDGGGSDDTGPATDALGITIEELQKLAVLYPNPGPTGKRLIRVELPHLSKWDINWNIAPPVGASGPAGGPPSGGGGDCKTSMVGSIIECESRTLAEELPIVGTPYTLRYQSDRTRARRTPVRIPLTPASFTGAVPKRVDWKINVAGREFTGSVNNTVGQNMYFTWDGLDGFNRPVQGRAAMDIQVGNTYDGVYTDTSEFGYSGIGSAITGDPAKGELTLWKSDQIVVGPYDASGLGFGGWSLSAQHVLDAENGDIYLGGGTTRSFDRFYRMSWVGGDETLPEQDGVSIKNTSLGYGSRAPSAIAADPDGSIWFSQGGLNTHPSDDAGIRRVRPDGIVERITGIGSPPFADPTDGMLASAARLYGSFIRVSPSGDLYAVDYHGNRIWRITNELPRRVRLVAGDGGVCLGAGSCGDGFAATLAQLNAPSSVAFDTAGNVYFAESNGGSNGRVRRIDPQGRIATLFTMGFVADAIEVDGLGKLLVHNVSGDIYEWPLSSDGSAPLQTVTANFLFATGGAASCANASMFLDGMKRVGFSCFNQLSLLKDPNTVQRIAGVSNDLLAVLGSQSYGDGRTALQASFSGVDHGMLAAAPDGSLLIIDDGKRIRRVQQQPLANNGTFQFPSADGLELYEFGARGKHTRTLSALTGAVRQQLQYDGAGNLMWIEDGNGLRTNVTRSTNQVQFTAPHGQVTTLSLNAATQLLSGLVNPGQTYSFTMSPDGLLTQMTDSRGGVHVFDYDPMGNLDRDKDAENKTQSLSQTYLGNGIKVEAKSAGGLSTFYTVTDETDGGRRVAVKRRVVTTPRNASYTDDVGADQVSVRTEANGTTVTRIAASDARYGAYAPAMTSTTKTPLNVTHFQSEAVTATLATPSDPLSVQTETRTFSENQASCSNGSGCTVLNQSTEVYDRVTNTRTYTSAMGRTRVETLDSKDRVVQVAIPGSSPIAISYDAEGHVYQVTQGSRTSTTTYVNGDLFTSQDSAGNVTTYSVRDLMGRPKSISLPGGRTLAYTYDAAGNTRTITPPGAGTHEQDFDYRDLQKSFTVPSPAATTLTTPNADRQLVAVTFPASYGINIYNYLLGLYSGVSADTNVSRGITRDAAERVASMTTGSMDGVGLGFTYDGHLQKSVTWSGNVVGAVNYEYDNHFLPYQLSVNATAAEARTFDADNLLTGVTLNGVTTTIARDPQNGRIDKVTTGNIVETRTYDATYGELSGLSYSGTSGNIYSVTYVRDALGRVSSKTETRGALPSVTTLYDYDAAGRLILENRGGAITTWGYDGNGNRRYRNTTDLGVADGQDRLPATYDSVPYTYVAATGDVASKGTTGFSWDRLGNLRSITRPFPASTITYLYDAQDRRVAKKLGPTYASKWLYDGQLRVIAELNSANAVQKRFVYGSRTNVPDTMLTGGVTYRLVTDHLGSVVAVVNVSGTTVVSESVTYDAWGNILSPASSVQPFRFAGGLYDADLALVHFGARDYDPSTGRWTSKDAARWDGGLNFYAYANNDPVNFIDPEGRRAKGAMIGFVVGYFAGGQAGAELGAKIGDFLTGSDDDDDEDKRGSGGSGSGSGGSSGGGSGGATGGGAGPYRHGGINYAHCLQTQGLKRLGCCRQACEGTPPVSCTPLPAKGTPARECIQKCFSNPLSGSP